MILSEKALEIISQLRKFCQNINFTKKFLFSAKPIRAGHHPSGIPSGPVGIRGGGARPPVVKALTEADLLRSSHREQN